MTAKQPFTYVVLRYVHDVLTGEFVNVGVALVLPSHRKISCQNAQNNRAN